MAAGFRGLAAPWVGGASANPPGGGYRSLLAFWLGGACGTTAQPATPQAGGGSFRRSIRIHVPPEKRSNDDDEVMFVLEVALKFLTKQ